MLPRTDSEGKRYERTLRDEKGGVFLAFDRGPHCATSPAVFRKGHRRGVPTRLAFGRYWRIGHLPALPHPQPCLAFGRDWWGGVAIELRPILQPTSLRARWTPCRDEFRVVRDDRRLVIMGAGTSGEDKSCTLGENRRVGILDAVIPKMGRSKDPEPKMRSRDGLAWNARWKVRSRGKARKRGYEGEPEGDRMGEGLPSVLRSRRGRGDAS